MRASDLIVGRLLGRTGHPTAIAGGGGGGGMGSLGGDPRQRQRLDSRAVDRCAGCGGTDFHHDERAGTRTCRGCGVQSQDRIERDIYRGQAQTEADTTFHKAVAVDLEGPEEVRIIARTNVYPFCAGFPPTRKHHRLGRRGVPEESRLEQESDEIEPAHDEGDARQAAAGGAGYARAEQWAAGASCGQGSQPVQDAGQRRHQFPRQEHASRLSDSPRQQRRALTSPRPRKYSARPTFLPLAHLKSSTTTKNPKQQQCRRAIYAALFWYALLICDAGRLNPPKREYKAVVTAAEAALPESDRFQPIKPSELRAQAKWLQTPKQGGGAGLPKLPVRPRE